MLRSLVGSEMCIRDSSCDINGKIRPDGFSVLIKFSSRKSLERHILETYFKDTSEKEYVCLAFQYVKIDMQNALNFDAKSTYMLEAENLRKNSETEKEKCRKRKQTETEKEQETGGLKLSEADASW